MAQNFKKEVRKKQIKEVAIKLIEKKGYKKTTIQNIIDELNYSKSGFYNCYKSKSELFKDILNDGINYRYKQIRTYKKISKNLDRKTVLIEALLDKMLEYNKYKKLFSNLVIEMKNSEELKKIYNESKHEITNLFKEFCKKEGLEEYIKVTNLEFGIFVNSIIIGVDVFDAYNNKDYREMLQGIITSYFEDINLFER